MEKQSTVTRQKKKILQVSYTKEEGEMVERKRVRDKKKYESKGFFSLYVFVFVCLSGNRECGASMGMCTR